MYIVGLTGGIATGKTTLSKLLAEYFPIVDGDIVTNEQYTHNALLIREIAAAFPEVIVNDSINKVKLATYISAHPEQLDRLEKITHPPIVEAILAQTHAKMQEGHKIVILSAPLLFETRLGAACHAIICLEARPETQKARAMERPNMTEEKYNLLYQRQWTTDAKKKKATITISTEQSIAETEAEILAFLQRFMKNHKVPLVSCKY